MTRNRPFLIAGLTLTLFLAGVVSWFASSSPDGLEKVAGDTGFLDTATGHVSDGSPLAGYEASFVDGRLGQSIAGIAGVALTLAIAYGLTWAVRRKAASEVPAPSPDGETDSKTDGETDDARLTAEPGPVRHG